MSSGFWKDKQVLVTGHTGFKGAWLSLWLEMLGARVVGLGLEPESSEGAYEQLRPSVESHLIDLRDGKEVSRLVEEVDPHVIFHLAAQSLVRESYTDPRSTYEVNVLGTLQLLSSMSRAPSLRAVVVTTTDKVYRNTESGRPFLEDDPLGGLDPYSSSKACVELLVEAWRKSFLDDSDVALVTARAGNVIGGGDHARDRLIPDAFRALADGGTLVLRYPRAVRPWQFVLEPLSGYLALAEAAVGSGELPGAFNFGPPPESWLPVSEVTDRLFSLWGSGTWEASGGSEPKESLVLKLDSTRAKNVLGWQSQLDLENALGWTVEWRKLQVAEGDLRALSVEQIRRFERMGG